MPYLISILEIYVSKLSIASQLVAIQKQRNLLVKKEAALKDEYIRTFKLVARCY
jgi:hypothetical protein